MTVGDIIEEVKWCIDHETREDSKLSDGGEDTYMDNIIKAKINYALRWVAVMTGQCTSMGTGASGGLSVTQNSVIASVNDVGEVTVPAGISATDIQRVRLSIWCKAAKPVDDTSDDAMLMFDDTAKGTVERPLATIMRGSTIKILVQPWKSGCTAEISYIGTNQTLSGTPSDTTNVNVSDTQRNAFIYYIAYLLLAAYEDPGAPTMLSIAVQSLGTNTQK